MPDNLFASAANLLSSAGSQTQETANRDQKTQEMGVTAGENASSELGAERRQQAGAMDAQKLTILKDKLDQASNMVQVTPQIALGLVKNTGDKEWLKMVGQKMRADVMFSMYQYGANLKMQSKEYKVPVGDKIVTMRPHYNKETSDWDFEAVAEGEKFSPKSKGEVTPDVKEKEKKGASGEDPKDKEFLKTYRQYQKDTQGMNGEILAQLGKKDPKQADDLQKKLDFVQTNTDRFNKLQNVKTPTAGSSETPQKFNSADDVRAAYKAGTLTRDVAKKILSDQFGMK
jgi:hypothetical protein